MNYTLITPTGQVYTFYLEETALCFAGAYGGTVISNTITLVDTETV